MAELVKSKNVRALLVHNIRQLWILQQLTYLYALVSLVISVSPQVAMEAAVFVLQAQPRISPDFLRTAKTAQILIHSPRQIRVIKILRSAVSVNLVGLVQIMVTVAFVNWEHTRKSLALHNACRAQ